MARVSIVMPTFNRGDVIRRAIDSVLAQTFGDWELVIVDDGSTDGTREALVGLDPRIRVIVQENQGVTGARNTALRHGDGRLIAFLDSDDAWPAHHLALATAFFDAHPGEHLFTSEFWEDFGVGTYVKHFQVETGRWYPATARRIGSRSFESPPPLGDPYLWFYQRREPAGAWAAPALAATPWPEAFHYSGDIGPMWRWGWLMAMQPTVITRQALEVVGPGDLRYRVASDYAFLASLCLRFRANLLSVPGCIKHEFGEGGRHISEDHLVTGRAAVRFHLDVLAALEELFWSKSPDDRELAGLRAFRQYQVGLAALRQGDLEVARRHLQAAAAGYPGADAATARWLVRLLPNARLAASAWRAVEAARWLPGRVAHRLGRALGRRENPA